MSKPTIKGTFLRDRLQTHCSELSISKAPTGCSPLGTDVGGFSMHCKLCALQPLAFLQDLLLSKDRKEINTLIQPNRCFFGFQCPVSVTASYLPHSAILLGLFYIKMLAWIIRKTLAFQWRAKEG